MPFTAIPETSKYYIDSSGESGHPCLVPDPIGRLSDFHHWVQCLMMHNLVEENMRKPFKESKYIGQVYTTS